MPRADQFHSRSGSVPIVTTSAFTQILPSNPKRVLAFVENINNPGGTVAFRGFPFVPANPGEVKLAFGIETPIGFPTPQANSFSVFDIGGVVQEEIFVQGVAGQTVVFSETECDCVPNIGWDGYLDDGYYQTNIWGSQVFTATNVMKWLPGNQCRVMVGWSLVSNSTFTYILAGNNNVPGNRIASCQGNSGSLRVRDYGPLLTGELFLHISAPFQTVSHWFEVIRLR